jgi:penicillin-binding protein 1A
MANSYMTFARRGERVEPYYVAEVKDAHGATLFTADPDRDQVLAHEYADLVNSVLSEVIERGTGQRADIGRPAAGKTGTTSENTDAWFVGYTPRMGAAVWMGYGAEGRRPMDDVHGAPVTGGSLPAQIWQRFMAEALEGVDTGSFVAPPEQLLAPPSTTSPPTSPTTASTTSTSTSSTSTTTTTVPETTTSVTVPDTTTTSEGTTTTVAPTTTAPTTVTTVAPGNGTP